MIAEIGQLELYAWALCFALQAGLMGLLIFRQNYKAFPAFTTYLAGSLAQNITQFITYKYWGFRSQLALEVAWSLRTAIVLLRAMAVLEICRQLFGNYRGIWTFIWRTLVISVALVFILSIMLSKRGLEYGILYGDRAVGLGEAFAIVALLLFARYYGVQLKDPIRALVLGFFLYSCFEVVNDTVLEALAKAYFPIWNFLGTVSYTGSVLVWGWGLRQTAEQPATAPEMLPAGIYHALSPEVNRRLGVLNERLSQFTKREAEHP